MDLWEIINKRIIRKSQKKDNDSLLNRIKKQNSENKLKCIRKSNQNTHLIEEIKKAYHKKILYVPDFNIDDIKKDYNFLLTDKSVENPFIINSELVKIIKDYTANIKNDEEKAKRIFNWIRHNIKYDNLRKDKGYQNSRETLEHRLGICGEMAFLYITMARAAGLKSKYVSVKIDCDNKKVNHGCAVVYIGNKSILVDPAYHKFNVHHKRYEVVNDNDVARNYDYWRNGKS
ncbi:MAG: transglutaminase-like domain-containing protein [Nanoarchaeota archaeon]|nr:transglutaminase-like domain-containing protein [Nanoarchaeota archaeon]